MKQFILILFCIVFGIKSSFSQNTDSIKTRLSFSVNLIQCPINELSLYADYCLNKKNSFGINVGYIYANPKFKVFFLSDDQGTYPGTVWNGMVFRADYKHCMTNNLKKYWEAQLIYKTLSYLNQSFDNVVKDNHYYFKRNENAYLIGLDVINGRNLTKYNSHFNSEIFWGFGFRYRKRDYTTISSYPEFANPLGSFVLKQFYPTLIFGLKIGFNIFLKK